MLTVSENATNPGEVIKIDIVALEIDNGERVPDETFFNGGHKVYREIEELFPLEELNVSQGDDIDMSEEEWDIYTALDRVHETWLENGTDTEFHVGVFDSGTRVPDGGVCGVANQDARSSVINAPRSSNGCSLPVFAHEVGHNLNLSHTVACEAGPPHDPDYPYEDGHVGDETAWDTHSASDVAEHYVYRSADRDLSDFMGYCDEVISSHYHYAKVKDRLIEIYYPPEDDTATLPLALITSLQPGVFEQSKTLLVSGRSNAFGQRSTTFMETVHKSMESVSKAGSGHTISLVDDHSGAVIYSESLRIHEVDHATHKVWSARLPAPRGTVTLKISDTEGSLVHFSDLK